MDIFEAIELMKQNSEKLDQTLRIPDLSQPYWEKAGFSPAESPFRKQLELLNEIASNTTAIEDQAVELKRIADSAEKSAALAEREAESAKRDARFSKIVSVISVLISAGSLAVAIIALVFSVMR